MSKINETIARLDREARRLGLELSEPGGVNRRGFEFRPTRRWMEFRPGGKGIVEVTAFATRNGPVEAVAHKDVNQMIKLMVRAIEED